VRWVRHRLIIAAAACACEQHAGSDRAQAEDSGSPARRWA
jgi:hypothetical protein